MIAWPPLRGRLSESELAGLAWVQAKIGNSQTQRLVWLASLPRRVGKRALAPELVKAGVATLNLGAWRAADVAAAVEFIEASLGEAALVELWDHGDQEERRMVGRSVCLGLGDLATPLLWDRAHRQNDQILFEATFLDSDHLARLADDEVWARAVLKAAFLNLDLARLYGFERRLPDTLQECLADFAAERRAAGRPVWPGTYAIAMLGENPRLLTLLTADRRSTDPTTQAQIADATRLAESVR